jgi:hypothetical protein
MNPIARNELWQRLRQHALVTGDVPPLVMSTPWYVRVMLGVAGWIGALFLMGFVGVGFAFVMKSAVASVSVGMLCCGAAFAIFRMARNSDFASQFGLAVSLAGQGMIMSGIFNVFKFDAPAAFLWIAALEASLAVLMPNFIHRVLATAGAVLALSMSFTRFGIGDVVPAITAAGMAAAWLNERRWAAHGALLQPIGYGLTLALLAMEGSNLFREGIMLGIGMRRGPALTYFDPYIGAALLAAVFVYAVARLLSDEGVSISGKAGVASMAAALLAGALAFPASGITVALLILLVKSTVLAATGVALLAARIALQRYFPAAANKENSHA